MFEIIEKDVAQPRLTVNPKDGRVTLKIPNGYDQKDTDRLTIFSKHVADCVVNDLKEEKTQRGRIGRTENDIFNIKMYCEVRSTRKKTWLPMIYENQF